jgi:histidine ammonia-lyase
MHPADTSSPQRVIHFDQSRLHIEDIVDIAKGDASAALSTDPEFRAAIARGAEFLDQLLREDGNVYGVTTGYGDSCTVNVPPELVAELPHHLYTYHGCGLGEYFNAEETRALMATRLASLCKACSMQACCRWCRRKVRSVQAAI